ncbi:hypothetical protein [Acrocarpospora phusangensis]|uniref:hypothetical protein n=1 Tax=Acrocarpospora phusangensis TaxID=1070424 RepID=UPI0019519F2A|nr:hypothetical protein [Acrocarpospora phusangensis]
MAGIQSQVCGQAKAVACGTARATWAQASSSAKERPVVATSRPITFPGRRTLISPPMTALAAT